MTVVDERAQASTRLRLSRRAILLAASTSVAVIAAAILGALSLPVVVLAMGGACTIAVLSVRDSRPRSQPYTLQPVAGDQDQPSTPVIAAPRAKDIAGTRHTDVA